jgi:hypothetical protein
MHLPHRLENTAPARDGTGLYNTNDRGRISGALASNGFVASERFNTATG